MTSPNNSSEVEKSHERVLQLPVWLRKELDYLAFMKPENNVAFYHNIAVSGERILEHFHQSEIKGRIDVLQLQRGVMGKYKGDGVFDKKYFELVEIEINNLTESLNQMKGKDK